MAQTLIKSMIMKQCERQNYISWSVLTKEDVFYLSGVERLICRYPADGK